MTDILKFDENYKPTDLTNLMNPNIRNTKETTTRYFIIQLLKTSDKAKKGGERHTIYGEMRVKLTDFLSEACKKKTVEQHL